MDVSRNFDDLIATALKRKLPKNSISWRIRDSRLAKGYTFASLGRASGVSERTVYKYENQIIPENSFAPDILMRLADVLGKEPYYFCNEYHKWLATTAYEDVARMIASRGSESIDELASKCVTTHRSLYAWRDKRGKPTYETYLEFKRRFG